MARRTHPADDEFEQQNMLAVREAREADRVEPRADSAWYDIEHRVISVRLRNGYVFGFPRDRIPELVVARADQLSRVRISPSGEGLHWDELDVDLSLTELLTEALKLQEWTPRLMGQSRSDALRRRGEAI